MNTFLPSNLPQCSLTTPHPPIPEGMTGQTELCQDKGSGEVWPHLEPQGVLGQEQC